MVLSLGQIYGDVLYYATSLLDVEYCRPERYYFWFYYFFFNFIWMVFGCCEFLPLHLQGRVCVLMVADYVKQGVAEILRAFKRVGEIEGVKKGK